MLLINSCSLKYSSVFKWYISVERTISLMFSLGKKAKFDIDNKNALIYLLTNHIAT